MYCVSEWPSPLAPSLSRSLAHSLLPSDGLPAAAPKSEEASAGPPPPLIICSSLLLPALTHTHTHEAKGMRGRTGLKHIEVL